MKKFIDRYEAGFVLSTLLKEFAHQKNSIVLALPRGGVPIGYEIAKALSLPLDVFIVRKLGVPGYAELAMGAIASNGTVIFNEPLINQLNIASTTINAVMQREQEELVRREHLYRGDRPFLNLKGKTIILVDDGIATGSTIPAAIEALNKYKPASIVIAVPVTAYSACEELAPLVDQIVCPLKPINFHAVGLWYENFPQTSDNEVIELLKKAINAQ